MSEEKKNEEKVEKVETPVEVGDAPKEEAPKADAKKSWLNRIVSAIIGAAIAIGAVLGITQEQVNVQKAKIEQIRVLTTEAMADMKSGKLKEAEEKLQKAITLGKEVAEAAKAVVDKVKAAKDAVVNKTAETKQAETAVNTDAKATVKTEAKADVKATETAKPAEAKK